MATVFASVGGVRLVACIYLVMAAINLITDGWRSFGTAGWVLLALGFFVMASADGRTYRSSRSPRYLAGVAVSALGLVLVVYEFVRVAVRA